MKQTLLIFIAIILFLSHGYCAIGTKIRIIPVQGTVLVGFDKDTKLGDDSKVDVWDQLDWIEIKDKMPSTRRTYIDTGDDGYAKVQFYKSRSLIRLLPETKLFIEQNNIYVYSGKSFYKIEKKSGGELVVRTPTAIAGIRGTIFEVAVDDLGDKSDFSVYEGAIEVASEKNEKPLKVQIDKKLSVFDGEFKGGVQKFDGKKRAAKFWNKKSWKQRLRDRFKKIQLLKKFKKFNLLNPGQANNLFKNSTFSKIREMLSNNKLMKFIRSPKFQNGIKKWQVGLKNWRKKMIKARAARKKRRRTWWKKIQKNMKNNKGGWLNYLRNRFQQNKNTPKKNTVKTNQTQTNWQKWIQKWKMKP